MARVVFDHVSKSFGDVLALQDLSLEIRDGEFLAILGPSGSGKSLILRLLAGLEAPTSGEILIGNHAIVAAEPPDRDLALVLQSYPIYPQLSIRENLLHPLQLRGMASDEVERRLDDAASFLGLRDLLDRQPAEISGGERQRVALGRALISSPAVLLLDDPLSQQDLKLRARLRAELVRFHSGQKTLLYVTTDQTEALLLADRVLVLDRGAVQQIGAPDEVYHHPVNLFVASFLGDPPMNLLDARLESDDNHVQIVAPSFSFPFPVALSQIDEEYLDREVIVGIRPQHVFHREEVEALANGANVTVGIDVIESLGSEKLAHATVGAQTLTARVSVDSELRRGQTAEFVVDLQHLHLFDRESQRSILR